jgi:hypothetical protein
VSIGARYPIVLVMTLKFWCQRVMLYIWAATVHARIHRRQQTAKWSSNIWRNILWKLCVIQALLFEFLSLLTMMVVVRRLDTTITIVI